MARPPSPREHGTRKGYRQHSYDGTTPCDACRQAEAEYANEKRRIRVAEGRQKRYPTVYTPRPPRSRLYLDPAMMEAFIRGDEAATTEVRDEFRAALTAFKESHGTEVLAEARKRRKSAQGASSPTTTTGRQ